MSYIVSFTVAGLAGRAKPLELALNRDTNIFFGLNGSGKTSLLKILHSAMANETEILESVPFAAAEVKIYSQSYEKVFTRSITKVVRSQKGKRSKRRVVRRDVLFENEVMMFEEPASTSGMRWSNGPSTPAAAAKTRWAHQYLPTSRLHIGDAPGFLHMASHGGARSWLTEDQLDAVFAKSVEYLWSRYSAEVLGAVRTAQEKGLANILRAVLFPQSASNRRKAKLTSAIAYERVRTFLERQGSASILGKQSAFEKRYASDPTLQDVVRDIEAVEDQIKSAMTSRNTLEELITRLFRANKNVVFTDEAIEVRSHSGDIIGLASLSSGEKHLLRVLVEALLVDESSLMIDEPEISMHVDWQKVLVQSLRSLNPKAQFIFATHSPEVLADVPDDKIFNI